jgi:hypothetical protein
VLDESKEDRRRVLAELREWLWTLGTANDAQDRGCAQEAEVLRRDSCEGIRTLMAKHPFLMELLPGLQRALDSGHILGVGWSTLSDRLDEHVTALGKEQGNDSTKRAADK